MMKLSDLNFSNAPESGQILAYTRQAVIFEPYRNLREAMQKLNAFELLELHLFNDVKEYRAITSDSSRFSKGWVEYTADFPEDDEEKIFREEIQLEQNRGTITVLNHILYNDENGQAVIDDYRLKAGGIRNE